MTYLMLNGKSMLRFAFILSSTLFLASQDAGATHIVGGDLTYRCLGNNLYEIRLTVRRDCFLGAPDAQFDNPASVGFFDGVTNQLLEFVGFAGQLQMNYNEDDTLNQILVSDCSVVSGDVCVHQTTYVDTIFLPYRASGYIMAYQRCCRNSSLNNVLNPLGTGMTLIAELSGFAQLECNSSPQFSAYPPIYICVNKPINFLHFAIDSENDSLVYSLCAPYAGGDQVNNRPQPPPNPPYNPINFRPPYSLTNLLGGTPLQINPVTGELTGTPNAIGQFVVGICVTAYKDGVMTGTTRRDFQYNVRMCRDVPVAQFTAPTLDCEDLTVVFDNQSLLADEYLWIFDYPNPLSPTSTAFEPTHTYTQGGFYNVALIVNDSNEFCFDTVIHQIGVFDSQVDADFTFDVSSCTDQIILNFTDTSTDPDPLYDIIDWDWGVTIPGIGLLVSDLQNPTFNFPVDGPTTIFAVLVVTSSNGCTATQTKSFQVQQIEIQFNPESDSICFGESTHILLNGDSTLTYIWDPKLGLDLEQPWDPIAHPGVSVDYCVTVTDGLCEVDSCLHVGVQQLPTLAFDYETDCRSLLVQFDNNSMDATLYHWDFGVPVILNDTSNLANPSFTYPIPGMYTVTLSSRDGCNVSVTKKITADAITETLDDQTISCFQESVALNPVFNPNYQYVWSHPEFLNNPNSPNPIATVENDTEFCVTISSPTLPDCEIVECITVVVSDDFTLDAGASVTTCELADILLTATTTPNLDDVLNFVWTNQGGETLSVVKTLTVTPLVTATYFVSATDSLGCSKNDSVIVFRPKPTFFVLAANDTSYCNIQSIWITAETNDFVMLEWFNDAGVLIGEGDSVLVTPGTGPTCFIVMGTDTLGCNESDTICLTPTFFNLDITPDQSTCLDESVQVCIIDHLGQDLDYLWSPIELVDFGGVTVCATVSPPETTTYCALVTNNVLGCTMTLCTEVVVNLFESLTVVITAEPDSIVLSESVQLTVNQPCSFSFVWASSNPADPPIPGICNPVVFPTQNPTTYTVTVTNEAGCTQVASISVGVADPLCNEEDIFIPTAFTPNNDGVNDMLFVRSNFISTINLHIYNRWGEQVFQTNDQTMGWDGKYKGKRLPPDVYGYYMEISCPNQKEFFQKGNITLLE